MFVGSPRLCAERPLRRAEQASAHTLLDASPEQPLYRYFRDAPGGEALPFARVVSLGTIEAIRQRVLVETGRRVAPLPSCGTTSRRSASCDCSRRWCSRTTTSPRSSAGTTFVARSTTSSRGCSRGSRCVEPRRLDCAQERRGSRSNHPDCPPSNRPLHLFGAALSARGGAPCRLIVPARRSVPPSVSRSARPRSRVVGASWPPSPLPLRAPAVPPRRRVEPLRPWPPRPPRRRTPRERRRERGVWQRAGGRLSRRGRRLVGRGRGALAGPGAGGVLHRDVGPGARPDRRHPSLGLLPRGVSRERARLTPWGPPVPPAFSLAPAGVA